ncbi:MAG: hypothetical protein KDA60_12235, partial [Planctomycetales bacterium]|nr:hypothetical protein [Planctomycetales bacterium]
MILALFSRLRLAVPEISGEERASLTWSFLWFFSLLFGYYLIRPLREGLALQGDQDFLARLFLIVFFVMLAAVPAYGWLATRFSRPQLVRVLYHGAAASLALFSVWMFVLPNLSVEVHWQQWTTGAFYVFVSVYNMFVVSLFWSVLADIFSSGQGKRLFGLVAAAGTTGGMCGSLVTATIVERVGIPAILFGSAMTLECCIIAATRLEKAAQAMRQQSADVTPTPPTEAAGGGIWDGVVEIGKSPYLAAFCVFLLFGKMCATTVYFAQNQIIPAHLPTSDARAAFFGKVNMSVQIATLLLQTFVAGQLMRRAGLIFTLVLIPMAYLMGFIALGLAPVLGIVVLFDIAQRSVSYAIAVPAREVLFTVV